MKKQIIRVNDGVLSVEYPTIGKKFSVDLSIYSDSIRGHATIHGFKQKFGDAESGGTPAEKYAMVQRIHENLLNDSWELVGERDNSGVIVEAICNLKKLKEDVVRKAATPEKLKEWATNAKVKAEIAQIRAKRAAKAAKDSTEEIEIEL